METYGAASNVPPDIKEAVEKQELKKVKETILAGVTAEEGLSKPKPEKERPHQPRVMASWTEANGW